MLKYLLPLLLAVFTLTACRTTAVLPVTTSIHGRSDAAVERAIMAGCADRGWKAHKVGSHEIEASIVRRGHRATVSIPYSASGYKIVYKNSSNLDYNGRKIHRAYRNWTHYLDSSIRQHL